MAATSFDTTRIQQVPLSQGLLQGPESVAFDAQGHVLYSGVSDGRVLRWNGDKFHHKSGNLYVADAYRGLMRVGPGGAEAIVLVNVIDDLPLCFTNRVDVDQVTRLNIATH
ncbi:hypothetical protein VPH35_060940 [Triticum aestivum]|uniref:Strictosidine synthase conserved region domain-containing protein n=1 Tax=Aegilops tauschii TaxID=37682 RepID=M8BKB2_AEGTA